ncbi:MAG: acireductone synthase [Methylocystis silviterrae]
MNEQVRAVLIELEAAAVPMAFVTGTLTPLAQARLGAFIAEHASDPDVEDALEETGRLLGGFDLKLEEAEALLLRWMKQNRKATPLKTIQGLIWRESYEAGALKSELYPDVAESLRSWAASGLRLFVYSSNSRLAQQLLLSHSASGDLTSLFEEFFDTSIGQKIEPAPTARSVSVSICLRDLCWRCRAMGRNWTPRSRRTLRRRSSRERVLQTVAMRFALISRH